ncbi:MAG TPA: hypothetical protein PLJ84_00800 [Bacteroidales bacterium]|nr:hypothetical protein [Bacteroidales bacterium]HPT01109.1 hypothetical protein [Bacteroidales bacterium]
MRLIRTLTGLFLLAVLPYAAPAAGQTANTDTGPRAYFKLDGNGIDAVSGLKASILHGKVIRGHDGKEQGAYEFTINDRDYSKSTRSLTFPVDINASKWPSLTITAWVKASNYFMPMYVITNYTNNKTRGLILDKDDDMYRWGMCCGKDGMLWGPTLVEGWTFVAMIYDDKNQEARLIVNDEVFSSRAKMHSGENKAFVGAFKGAIDDVRFYDRILSAAEIEAISGKPIVKGADDLAIKDRYSYKERLQQEKENKLVIGGVYIVDKEEIKVFTTTNQENTADVLRNPDSLKVLEKLPDGWYKISYGNGKTGFARRSEIVNKAYPEGSSVLKFRFMNWLSNVFDFTKLKSWIFVLICAVILFYVKRKFNTLDDRLLKLRPAHDQFADGGSKSDASVPPSQSFLHRIYPVKKYRWYPLLGGILLGATIFIASFWDGNEMEWFFNEGFNILPIGYDRPVHWFMYGMCMITILLTLSWIVESFVIGGPLIGLLRVFILLILNCMALLVSFFLLVLIAFLVIGILVLKVLGSAAGSGKYKCPHCGRTFSASAGSNTRCPGCGASLTT